MSTTAPQVATPEAQQAEPDPLDVRPKVREAIAQAEAELALWELIAPAIESMDGKVINARFETVTKAALQQAGHTDAHAYYEGGDRFSQARLSVSEGPVHLTLWNLGKKGSRFWFASWAGMSSRRRAGIEAMQSLLASDLPDQWAAMARQYLGCRRRLTKTLDVPEGSLGWGFTYAFRDLVRRAERPL